MNAALHGIVEEEEYRALGSVEANLNREAGIFEPACQIGQGLIEYVIGIHGATLECMRVWRIGAPCRVGMCKGELSMDA